MIDEVESKIEELKSDLIKRLEEEMSVVKDCKNFEIEQVSIHVFDRSDYVDLYDGKISKRRRTNPNAELRIRGMSFFNI